MPADGRRTSWSAHAYGLAIDVNPFMNPYQRGDVVLPGSPPAICAATGSGPAVRPGSVVVREFARIGWSWGVVRPAPKDYQNCLGDRHDSLVYCSSPWTCCARSCWSIHLLGFAALFGGLIVQARPPRTRS